MTTAEEHKSGGLGKDLIVYLCILALAAIQFIIAYQSIDGSQMFVRMLTVAIIACVSEPVRAGPLVVSSELSRPC